MSYQKQAQRILELLLNHKGEWVELWRILQLGIGSHTRRIHELRSEGWAIEMHESWHGKQRRTAYRID